MTLLTVVQDVCAAVGVLKPTSVFSNITGNRTMQEMLSLANEIAQRIAYETRDWTKLRAVCTLPGDGVTTAFDLPANYKRMLLTSNVWRTSSQQQPMRFIADTDEWVRRRMTNIGCSAWGEWTMLGGQILIYPAMTVPVGAYFAYLDKNSIDLLSGGHGDVFTDDGDSFTLGDRLLKLGMIWQWKANKGTPYQEDLNTYSDALAYAMAHDGPAPILTSLVTRSVRGWHDVYIQ